MYALVLGFMQWNTSTCNVCTCYKFATLFWKQLTYNLVPAGLELQFKLIAHPLHFFGLIWTRYFIIFYIFYKYFISYIMKYKPDWERRMFPTIDCGWTDWSQHNGALIIQLLVHVHFFCRNEYS